MEKNRNSPLSELDKFADEMDKEIACYFADWLSLNWWVCRGRIGEHATWRKEPPGTEWGEGEMKTTPELYREFEKEKK